MCVCECVIVVDVFVKEHVTYTHMLACSLGFCTAHYVVLCRALCVSGTASSVIPLDYLHAFHSVQLSFNP